MTNDLLNHIGRILRRISRKYSTNFISYVTFQHSNLTDATNLKTTSETSKDIRCTLKFMLNKASPFAGGLARLCSGVVSK